MNQKTIRLNKFIAECGITSRRNADDLIRDGRIQVNNKIVMELGYSIDPEKDKVYYDGDLLRNESVVYYLLNKPKGYVTTTKDEKHRKIITELIPKGRRVFPVGRLDVNTTGVLLLTNDGDFSNFLLHPSHKFVRSYIAKLHRPISEEEKERLCAGIILDKRKSKFASMEILSKDKTKVRVTTVEGRNHFVKKMFAQLGAFVDTLHREKFADFSDFGLPIGSFRVLNVKEIESFMKKYAVK
jgi:23S rRNA pseudouridine2605 synthase